MGADFISDHHEMPGGQFMSRSGHLSRVEMDLHVGHQTGECQMGVLLAAEVNSLNMEKWE